RYTNGTEVEMHDLRASHNHGNLQALSRNRLTKMPKPKKERSRNRQSVMNTNKSKDGLQEDTLSEKLTKEPPPKHIVRINQGPITLNVHRQPFSSGRTGELL